MPCWWAGCSRYATGVPGSLNHLVPAYCALEFFIGALGCFPVSNNAALFAEVGGGDLCPLSTHCMLL